MNTGRVAVFYCESLLVCALLFLQSISAHFAHFTCAYTRFTWCLDRYFSLILVPILFLGQARRLLTAETYRVFPEQSRTMKYVRVAMSSLVLV